MSALLFNVIMEWVMQRTTEDKTRGRGWTVFSALEDRGFADDLALVSHSLSTWKRKHHVSATLHSKLGWK